MLKWGFDRSYEVARIGLNGGLALGWNDSWTVSILYSSLHFIHTEVTEPLGNLALITYIHGHPVLSHRNQIWEELYHLGAQIQHSWLCIGDFNQVISKEDKFSFKSSSLAGNNNLLNTLSTLALMPIDAKGLSFTWINNRQGEDFVMENLDRAFGNVPWLESYPHSITKNLPILYSDHGPILLDTESCPPSNPDLSDLNGCGPCIWTVHPSFMTFGPPHVKQVLMHFVLKKKTEKIREKFKVWNKASFGHVEKEIEQKTVELKGIQERIQSVEDVYRERALRDDLEDLLQREQIMRRRNRILQIKNDEEVWLSNPKDVDLCINQYFKTLYTQPQNLENDIFTQLDDIPIPSISEDQAAQLDKPILDEEMGPLKTPRPDGIPAAFYQKFWTTIQHDIINMVKAFFHSGSGKQQLQHWNQVEIIKSKIIKASVQSNTAFRKTGIF